MPIFSVSVAGLQKVIVIVLLVGFCVWIMLPVIASFLVQWLNKSNGHSETKSKPEKHESEI